MLTRTHRFHGYGSLRFVYAHGHTVRSSGIALRYYLNDRRQTYRCAVVVSKKTVKSAVRRNRIRRRIYEQIRLNDAKILKPYDIVVTVFSDTVEHVPADQLRANIAHLLRQAGIVDNQLKTATE